MNLDPQVSDHAAGQLARLLQAGPPQLRVRPGRGGGQPGRAGRQHRSGVRGDLRGRA